MTDPTVRPPGRFVWHDLMTREGEVAQRFYTELLGWTLNPIDMGGFTYPMILVGGLGTGGIIEEKSLPDEVPSHWMNYVRVADVEAAAELVTEHGGSICIPITPIPGVGRFFVLTDPQGAALSAIQLDDPQPSPDRSVPGAFTWVELHAKDPAAVKPFYSAVFGWQWNEVDMGPMGTYHLVAGDPDFAGCMQLPPEVQAPPAWMPYVNVEDVDATHAKASGLGASTYVPPSDIPGIGRFAVIADPTGAAFAIYKNAH